MDEEKLTSVVIPTYNQQDFIIETLESIKHQTYKPIELVVSDDASSDSTVALIDRWLSKNTNYFANIIFLKQSVNLGVTKNISTALKKSTGYYIKLLAGDDFLIPSAIKEYVDFCQKNKSSWCMSQYYEFHNPHVDSAIIRKKSQYEEWVLQECSSIQLLQILIGNYITAPTVFMERSLAEQIEFFDSPIRNMEDYPAWIKLLRMGHSIRYLPKPLVYYRMHEESLSHTSRHKRNANIQRDAIQNIESIIRPNIPNWALLIRFHKFIIKLYYRTIILLLPYSNKEEPITRFMKLLSPIFLFSKLDPQKERFTKYIVQRYAKRLDTNDRKGM